MAQCLACLQATLRDSLDHGALLFGGLGAVASRHLINCAQTKMHWRDVYGFLVGVALWLARKFSQRLRRSQKEKMILKHLNERDGQKQLTEFCKRLAHEIARSWSHKEDWNARYRLVLLLLAGCSIAAAYPFDAGSERDKWRTPLLNVGVPFSAALLVWSIGVYQAYYSGWHALNMLRFQIKTGAILAQLEGSLETALGKQEASFTFAFSVLTKTWARNAA